MASRRDLLDSYQFAARRVVSAAVMHQSDPADWPYRRLGGAGLAAVMITVIALAATGVYGMISPGGNTSWQDGGSVIVVGETGASYVYLDGKLHPTANFTSAALLAGTTTTTSVSAASLEGEDYDRGTELGIAGAPTNLPTADDLVSPPWSLCTQQVSTDSGDEVSRTSMVVGQRPGAGTELSDVALLVRDTGTERLWLIWHGLRFRIGSPAVVRLALSLDNQVTVPVGDAWLQALPSGEAIAPIDVPSGHRLSAAVAGTRVGDILRVPGAAGTEYFLTLADRLRPISELQAQIQRAAGARMKKMSVAQISSAEQTSSEADLSTSAPAQVPDFADLDQSDTVVCAAWEDGSFSPTVLVNSEIPVSGGLDTSGVSSSGTTLADRVWVAPGKATLVQALPSPASTDGPLYLVTDQGIRYAVPSDTALSSLGLGDASTWSLPAGLVARLPEGPALDPDAARAVLQEEG